MTFVWKGLRWKIVGFEGFRYEEGMGEWIGYFQCKPLQRNKTKSCSGDKLGEKISLALLAGGIVSIDELTIKQSLRPPRNAVSHTLMSFCGA